jgi:hypothetical protein
MSIPAAGYKAPIMFSWSEGIVARRPVDPMSLLDLPSCSDGAAAEACCRFREPTRMYATGGLLLVRRVQGPPVSARAGRDESPYKACADAKEIRHGAGNAIPEPALANAVASAER